MSYVWMCDACGSVTSNPYEVKMKEFYVGCSFVDFGVGFPINERRKTKVHLCDECYKSLKLIARKLEDK